MLVFVIKGVLIPMNWWKTIQTESNFYRKLLTLALPLVLQNLMTHSLSLIDTVMVGHLGEQELAAVTYANTPFFIIMLLVFGMQGGVSILISQYWGRRNLRRINQVLGISLYLAGIITFLCSAAVFFFTDTIMGLITSNQDLIPLASSYAKIVAFGFFINSFSMMYIAAQRSIGNARFGMYVLGISMCLNTFLNWIFIFGHFGMPAMGIEGAALATLLARCFELLSTGFFAIRMKNLPLQAKALLIPSKIMLGDFVRYATPVVANETLWGLAFSVYPIIIGHMTDNVAAMAAFTIAGNIERIASSVTFGLGHASAVIIGNAIGARETYAQVYHKGTILNFLSVIIGILGGLLILAVSLLVIRPFLFPLFDLTTNAQVYCTAMLYIIALLSPIRCFNFNNIVGVLRGGGDVKVALFIDIGFMYLVALPLAAVFTLVLNFNVVWIYLAMALDEVCRVGFGLFRFVSHKWIHDLTRANV